MFDVVYEFCGFETLAEMIDDCKDDETRRMALTLFKTGARISEALPLERKQITINADEGGIEVHRMIVLKYKGDASVRRDVTFPKNELLTDEWFSLLPSAGPLFKYKYDWYYQHISAVQKQEGENYGPWFPHRFRSERARQLMKDYGYGIMDLQEFFKMASTDTPVEYVRPHEIDLKKKMGLNVNVRR